MLAATHCVSAALAGSSMREWKACVVASSLAGTASAASWVRRPAIASGGPAITVSWPPFTAAMSRPAIPDRSMRSRASASDRGTAAMAPPGSAWISWAR